MFGRDGACHREPLAGCFFLLVRKLEKLGFVYNKGQVIMISPTEEYSKGAVNQVAIQHRFVWQFDESSAPYDQPCGLAYHFLMVVTQLSAKFCDSTFQISDFSVNSIKPFIGSVESLFHVLKEFGKLIVAHGLIISSLGIYGGRTYVTGSG